MATNFNHNKKKNLLLLWEFFSYYMANAILENKSVEPAKNTVSKYFFGNKQLKTEFDIVKSLLEIKGIKSQDVAAKCLRRLEEQAKKINLDECERGKNKLLAEFARIGDPQFYNRKINVEFYRNAAFAHTLVSFWAGRANLTLLESTRLEDYFVTKFQEEKVETPVQEQVLELQKEDIDNLVVHVMNKKFNEIYMKEFGEIQRAILKEWIFVQDRPNGCDESIDGDVSFGTKLSLIREETVSFLSKIKKQATLDGKDAFATTLDESIAKIQEANNKPIDDDLVAFHLSLLQMITELKASSVQEGV